MCRLHPYHDKYKSRFLETGNRRPGERVALLLGALGVFSSVTLLQHWRGHDSLLEEEPSTAPVEPTRAVVTYPPSLRYTRDESKMRTDADCAPDILYLLSVRYLLDGRWFPGPQFGARIAAERRYCPDSSQRFRPHSGAAAATWRCE